MPAQANIPINNFNSGELGPLVEARFDIDKYRAGCLKLENAFPLVEGGAKKMPGTYYAGNAKDADKKCRLVPFAFSTNENYILEFGDQYIRFWKDGGQIVTYDSYTKLLLHCNANTFGSTAFTDVSPSAHAVTAYGYAWIDTNVYKFGPGAAWFDGAVSYLSIPDSADWNFGSSPFTIDFWARFNTLPASSHYMGLFRQYVDANNWYSLYLQNIAGTYTLIFRVYQSGYLVTISKTLSSGIAIDTWHHIAVIRGWASVVNTWAITFDGVADTGTDSDAVPDFAAPFEIGRGYNNPTYDVYFSGWIDEFRVSKGIARWTADFTPGTVAYTSDTPYEKSTTYLEHDLFDLDISTQSADVLYIFHHSYEPQTLSHYADNNWVLADLGATGTVDIAKQSNGIAKTITGASKAAACVITCIAHGFSTNDYVYINGIAGMVELNWGVYQITKLTDNTFSIPVDSTGYITYTAGGYCALVVDLFAAAGNYPACGTFYEQRLVVAGPDNSPQRMQGSVQGDFPNFICDPNQTDYAIQFDLVSTKVDRLRWALGTPNALILGTAGAVWAMWATGDTPLNQTNVNSKQQISTGVGNIAPQLVNDSVIWVTRSTSTVRLLLYNFITNQWESPDLTRLNRNITKGATKALSGIVQTAFQAEPYPIFWAVRRDGQLIGMTFERQEQVYAWFRIVTLGEIESVAVISRDDDEDQVWVSVKRTIEGSDVRHIEYFMPQDIYSDLENAFFVHAGLTYNGTETDMITGLDYLEGETVVAVSEDGIIFDGVVSSGTITLDQPATRVTVGLPYTTTVKPMNPVIGTRQGTSRGSKHKIHRATLCFYETVGSKAGIDEDTLYDVPFGTGTTPELYTGDMTIDLDGEWDDQATIAIVHDEPFPFTLKAVIPRVDVNEA